MDVQRRIIDKLQNAFDIHVLNVINESGTHNVPAGSETHFKVVVVSPDFDGKRKVARHQSVYRVLEEEMQNGVHALALQLFTPDEWEQSGKSLPDSPNCMGGSRS
ncbi:MAG: BolA family transcriptional regulator [Proteobacteria bacterium]|nr:MAG: BolA family transcriptional regulator [Pseudomonadota bacterium]PIE40368.1 MAG: BolA family transcriptional regulator [Gammaproteobacteria bacterium]